MSASLLSHTQTLLFLITGADKSQAIQRWRNGATDLPVTTVMPDNGVDVLVDEAALAA
jgi:6-phosphogluconolactonase/glucosamine-6-phosphate isomerase/deaminase